MYLVMSTLSTLVRDTANSNIVIIRGLFTDSASYHKVLQERCTDYSTTLTY